MKKLILCLLLFGFIAAGHSQILLKEAKVDYKPESMRVDPNTQSLVIAIPEKTTGEFQKDPLEFMRKNFDIQKLVSDNQDLKYERYIVNFKSRKGFLAATFTKDGDLVASHQKFRNIRLPESARQQVVAKYRGAAILGDQYFASTTGWDVDKAYYKVKIKDGNKIRKVRVDQDRGQYTLTGL